MASAILCEKLLLPNAFFLKAPERVQQVVIDEASQATEPRCLIAFQTLA